MRKIHSFKSFNNLYEADSTLGVTATDQSKLYDQTLGLILTTILNSYTSLLSFPASSYDQKIDEDLDSVKLAPLSGKVDAFDKIMQNVKSASSDNNFKGAKEAVDAWVAAGSKAAEALSAIISQYKDQADEQEHINNYINAVIEDYEQKISDASRNNELKKDVAAAVKESEEFVFENFLQGKKGMIEDVSKKITLVMAKLGSFANTPGMNNEVQKLQSEVASIASQMGELLNKKNKDINKEDIKRADARLTEIPTILDQLASKMLKQDSTNKEAASILVQAFNLVQNAKNKEIAYLQSKEEALQKEKSDKIKVNISTDRIDYEPDNTKKFNPEVKKFQELVVDKFRNIKQIAGLPQFKMMGTDGKFGKGTRDIILILKKGFGLSDNSRDITKELMDEIQTQPIKESESKVLSFETYVNIYEDFNVSVAVDTAKSLPSYNEPIMSASSKSTGGGSSKSVFKEGSKGIEVVAIQNALKVPLKGTGEDTNQMFGPETKKAVMKWQKDNGLTPDGIIGPDTLKKMAKIKNLGTWTASMISKMSGTEVKPIAPKTTETSKQVLTNSQIQAAADKIISATNSPFTDEEKLLGGIKSLKSKKDFEILQSILKRSQEMKEIEDEMEGTKKIYSYTKKDLGIKERPRNAANSSIEKMINNSLESDNAGAVQDIVDHLKSIGINASYSKDSSGDFSEGTFKIS
jgi:murein L,D-transpeptidase YcbB/YkuD